MLRNMSRTLPPIFLLVAAFLVNLTLSRLVALEREQIGLLKALGYANSAVAAHYLKLVVVIAALGIVIGSVAGTWFGAGVTALYAEFFRFPFLVFAENPELYVAAAGLSILAAVLGAGRSLREIVSLTPAVAMQPGAAARFHRLQAFPLRGVLPQPVVMGLRTITRRPVRALFTTLGMAMSSAILIVSLYISCLGRYEPARHGQELHHATDRHRLRPFPRGGGACRSSRSADLSSSRCSSMSARRGCATCSNRRTRRLRRSSLSESGNVG
jgi:putative ABC transport system permease protein